MQNDFDPHARIEQGDRRVLGSSQRKLDLPQKSSRRCWAAWDALFAVVSRSINWLTHFCQASQPRLTPRSGQQSRVFLRAGFGLQFESLEERTVFAVGLSAGDIAFTGIQTDDPDTFSFVLLKTVDTTTTLTFTDNGWATAQNGFANTTESTATITFGSNYAAGTQFVVFNNQTNPASATFRLAGTITVAGSITGTLSGLSTSGDSILAYQGATPTSGSATNWIAGINTLPWGTSTSTNFSALPTALTNGVNAISFSSETDNGSLSLANASGVASTIRTTVNTLANWTTSNSATNLVPPSTTFTVTAGGNMAPVNSVPANQIGKADTPLFFSAGNGNAISIADSDAGNNPVRVTLTVTPGALTLNGTAGLTLTVGDGVLDPTLIFTGTISAINTALNGISFIPTAGYTGAASLQIVTNDLGNSGSGGALSDTDNVSLTIVPNVLLNEIKANPPGNSLAGDRYQYLELRGTPGAILNGISLAMLDGSGSSVGTADYVINLAGQTIGSNGLLLIKSDTGGHTASAGTVIVIDAALFDSVQGGKLSKTAVTFVLGYSTSGFVTGTDYDTNDNGTLDNLPSGLTILDNVGWVDWDTGGVVYGGVALTQSEGTPDAATRYNTNNSTTKAAWFNGDLYDVGNDPTQLLYDATRHSTIFPDQPDVASLTPGGVNFSEPPYITANSGLLVTTSTLANIINENNLKAMDFEQSAAELIYSVTALPTVGILKFNGIPVVANTTTFTQADITAGKLTYDAPNLPGSGGFSFSISDGTHAINGTFAITVNTSMDTILRIVSYNIASSGGSGTPRTGLQTILQAISAETYNGVQEQVDLFVLQEVKSQATTSQWIVDEMNAVYGAGTYARGTINGYTSGAGTQGVVYNTHTLQLQSEVTVGAGNGTSRQTLRYQFQPIGSLSNSVFYVYNSHLKASDTAPDQTQRAAEVQVIRGDADSLGVGVNIIYAGDFNLYYSSEAAYQGFLAAGNGQAVDPLNRPGNWHNSASFKDIFTQAPSVVSVDGMTGGGLDDRFDFQLVTNELNDNTGLEYLDFSYHTFGNNGSVSLNGNISDASSTALPGLANRTTVLELLRTVTDHLPVVVDYTFAANSNSAPPTWVGANNANWTATGSWLGSVPNSVTAEAQFTTTGGPTANLDLNQTINKLTFNATTSKNYTLSGPGKLTLAGTTPTITTTASNIGSQTVAVNLDLANGTTVAVNGGILNLNAPTNATLGTSVTATVALGATLNLGGAGNALSNGTTTHANVTNDGTLAAKAAGKRVGSITGAGTTTVTATGATLIANHLRQAGLTIGAGNKVTITTDGTNTGASRVTNLSINATGQLDLNNNDLIVDNGNLAAVTLLLKTGLDITGAYGGGPGITSTTFATNPLTNTVLGVATNAELGYANFSGQAVDANDILVKYTYFGDADLNGVVDTATDFDLYITGLTSGGSLGGWLYGDFDYNGTVDTLTDFDLYITGLTSQSGALLTAGLQAISPSGNLTMQVVAGSELSISTPIGNDSTTANGANSEANSNLLSIAHPLNYSAQVFALNSSDPKYKLAHPSSMHVKSVHHAPVDINKRMQKAQEDIRTSIFAELSQSTTESSELTFTKRKIDVQSKYDLWKEPDFWK